MIKVVVFGFFLLFCPVLSNNGFLLDNFGSVQNILQSTKSCTDQLIKSSKFIDLNRFPVAELAALCAKRSFWEQRSIQKEMLLAEPQAAFTTEQHKWLNKIHTCTTLQACLTSQEMNFHLTSGHNLTKYGGRHQLGKRQSFSRASRKEYRMLSDEERGKFHNALNALKTSKIDGKSKYDLLVIQHTPEEAPGAHWGPAFLPFHRELLRQIEVALRQIDPEVALPYWDTTLDEGLPRPQDSILWTPEFFGTPNGYITEGPFKSWTVYHNVGDNNGIYRSVAASEFGSLYQPSDLEKILTFQNYSQLTMCVDPFFELLHGIVHNWVGGHMEDIPISPNDPTFFFHHAFVDYIWEDFRINRQSESERENQYPLSEDEICSHYHAPQAGMLPFTIKNIDGLKNRYTQEFYGYEPSPKCSPITINCGSSYLFCQSDKNRCLSKIKNGGNCSSLAAYHPCYDGVCVNGICQGNNGPRIDNLEKPPTPPPAPPTLVSVERSTAILEKATKPSTETCSCTRDNFNFVETKLAEDQLNHWIPITILRGPLKSDVKTLPRNPEIYTILMGQNQEILPGKWVKADFATKPYWSGSALAQIPSLEFARTDFEAVIKVKDDGVECTPYCLQDQLGYVPCSGKFSFQTSRRTAEISSPVEILALDSVWNGDEVGRTNFLFLCSELDFQQGENREFSNDDSCGFQRFPSFQLTGVAEIVHVGITTEAACKDLCRQYQSCKSLMYFPNVQECIINSKSRLTDPVLFGYADLTGNRDVVYFDYSCNLDQMFER